MKSRIYTGTVSHTRQRPRRHQFRYRIYMLYLDLDELPELFDGRWFWSAGSRPSLAWFRESDHLGGGRLDLKRAVANLVWRKTGAEISGPVTLLTHLRYFGYCMNPVSFYYCWNNAGDRVDFIVAEINNTPWGERHCYVLDARNQSGQDQGYSFEFDKAFHVSPFMPMSQRYSWQLSVPGESLKVHMTSSERNTSVFSAGMSLRQKAITPANLARVLVRHPAMTAKVIVAIYWEALKLWLKRTPFHNHPEHLHQEALKQ